MRLDLHVITVSDRVSRGEATDASGPAIINFITSNQNFSDGFPGGISVQTHTVSDDKPKIQNCILAITSSSAANETARFIVMTGGTGFAPRDVTPEAVEPLLEKKAGSLVHAMLAHGLAKCTPMAWLSRAVAGVVGGSSLVITLPGSPKAVVECLEPIAASGVVHALKLLVNPADAHPTGTPPSAAAASSASTTTSSSSAVADRSRKSDFQLVTIDAALSAITSNTPAAPSTISVPVSSPAAVGCILAQDAVSAFPHPPFRASIKDGYAVIASDGTGTFPVAASFCAGADIEANKDFVLKPGAVCRVNTGGPIPDGADSVIQVEDTELVERTADGKEEAKIKVNIAAKKDGQDIRPIGCDVAAGATVVSKGTLITAAEVALLNSIGMPRVDVVRMPRIAVLSTGDELIDAAKNQAAGSTPPTGRIYDSNRPMLLQAAQSYASSVIDLGIARDVHSDTQSALDRGFTTADIIISTGGVSMGEVDWVKKCLIDSGAEVHFGRVAMKPGKPTTFATKQGKLFFALPGNPVSAMVCFYLFVVPALRKWAGHSSLHLSQTIARTLEPLRPDPERTEYHRCSLKFQATSDGAAELVATSTGVQASHRLLSMAGANGLLIIPPGSEPVPANARCPVMLVGPLV